MALAEDLSRLMGFGQGPDNNAEISMKIKPLGNVSNTVTPGQVSPTSGQAGVQTPLNQPSSPTLTAGGIGEGQGGNPSAPPPPVAGVQPGAGNPTLVPRPGGPHVDPPGSLVPNPGLQPGQYPSDEQANFGSNFQSNVLSQIRSALGLPDVAAPNAPSGPPTVQPPQANIISGNVNSAAVPPNTGDNTTDPVQAPQPPGVQTAVPPNMQMRNTPLNLNAHPLGAYTDDVYEAAVAQLQFETKSQYAKLLQELGFINDQGQFMPGTLETDAMRERGNIGEQRRLALEEVLKDAVRGNTVFSGRRAVNEANAQRPYDAALANLETVLGRELAGRYQGISELTRQFELGRNSLIADAAERRAAAERAAQSGEPLDGGPPPDDGGGPPEETSAPPRQFWGSQWGTNGDLVPAGYFGLTVGSSYNGNRYYAPTGQPNVRTLIVDRQGNIQGYVDQNGNTVKWYGGRPGGGGGPPLKTA